MTPGQKWYSEKRKDPRWQKKRLQIMERDGWQCQNCWSKDKTLNVHHKAYFKGFDPWNYADGFLITLCESCHQAEPSARRDVLELADTYLCRLSAAELLRVLTAICLSDRDITGQQFVDAITNAVPRDEAAKRVA